MYTFRVHLQRNTLLKQEAKVVLFNECFLSLFQTKYVCPNYKATLCCPYECPSFFNSMKKETLFIIFRLTMLRVCVQVPLRSVLLQMWTSCLTQLSATSLWYQNGLSPTSSNQKVKIRSAIFLKQ